MSEGGRLWGLARISSMAAGWSDPDVASKMLNAWVGMGNGFLQIGGYPLEIGWAMMRPEYNLSASFKGRKVSWANDTAGQWVVDSSGDNVANFNASLAEDMGLSQGTVENLDDLMFLLGHREYETAESGVKLVDDYKETWRRTLERCESWLKDARDRQAGGTMADLGAAKNSLEKVLKAGQRYPAVAARLRSDYGIDLFQLETQIETMKRQIAENRRNGRNGRGGGGRSSRGGNGLGP
jgi:hypothetical protein